jgi:hypothetical protein
MKIGIITINSAYNYGCVLQAYALERYLEKEGHDVKIINYRLPEIDNVYTIYTEKVRFSNPVAQKIYNALRKRKQLFQKRSTVIKAAKFENFILHTLNTTDAYTSFPELVNSYNPADFDLLITGSDQVWNGSITVGLRPAYFLDFDKVKSDAVRRISFASSIGKESLTNAEKAFFEHYLKNFDVISVREKSAQHLLKSLTDKKINLVADPTFLLEKSDFDELVLKAGFTTPQAYSRKLAKPYILVHVIGKDKNVIQIAQAISEKLNMPVIQNRREKVFTNEACSFSSAGPEEFIGLVRGASYVVTNSFHATVFSIIYHHDFITIPHSKYPERMANLLSELGLSDHLAPTLDVLPENFNIRNIDYAPVDKKFDEMRNSSRDFLQDCIQKAAVSK